MKTSVLLRIHRRVQAKLVRRMIGNAGSVDELAGEIGRLFPDSLEARTADAVALAEGALHGTEARRAIWEDADYLVAILATLTHDGDRARTAALAAAARTYGDHGSCACGRRLDESGEHDGGYGAHCG